MLIITPNPTIRTGVAEALDISNPKNFRRQTGAIHDYSSGPFRAVLDGIDANLHDCNESSTQDDYSYSVEHAKPMLDLAWKKLQTIYGDLGLSPPA